MVRTHSLESAPMRGLRLAPGGSRSPASETSKTPSTVGVQLDSRTRGRPDAGAAGCVPPLALQDGIVGDKAGHP